MKPLYNYKNEYTYFSYYKREVVTVVSDRYEMKYNFCRNIRTFAERKVTHGHMNDKLPVKIRGKRRPYHIPNSWDDIGISRHSGKSWKDYTKAKKQYLKNL